MKKLVVMLAVMAFVGFGVAFAAPTNTNIGGNQNVSDNTNTSNNTNVDNVTNHNDSNANSHSSSDSSASSKSSSDQNQGQLQGQLQGQSANNKQGQAQSANNSGVNPTNTTTTNDSTNIHEFMPAPTAAVQGTDNVNASSPFFNAGLSSTKKYIILKEEYNLIQMMKADQYLSPEDAKSESMAILDAFKAETRRKKFLGFVPYTRNACDNALLSTVPLVCD